MALMTRFAPSSGWDVEILATDLSTRALAAAERAVWPLARAKEIPRPYLAAYMLRGRGAAQGRMKASPELRRVVRFDRLNLNQATYPARGSFDLVFCRNVLIYFDAETRAAVVGRLLGHLAAEGLLILGQVESPTALRGRRAAWGRRCSRMRGRRAGGAAEAARAVQGRRRRARRRPRHPRARHRRFRGGAGGHAAAVLGGGGMTVAGPPIRWWPWPGMRTRRPDVIVLDPRMPRMDGLTFLCAS
jgi:CheY-like chemotaxis protein